MKFNFLTILLWGIFFPTHLTAKVWINELMQSNIDLVRDDLQEFPDSWIELYNDSEQAVNIQNWTISDDTDVQKGWKISGSVVIAAKSYLLIYADKVAQGLHTHFRLDSGNGGAVYLFDEDGEQMDAYTNIPKQPAPNISFGRLSDGNATWVYFVEATPGASNTGNISNVVLPAPVFSIDGGIFKNSVNISLSLPAGVPSAVALSNIHYTLDNTEPTVDSPVYSEEITITQTTVVRAKLIHPNYLTHRAAVHSYIISTADRTLPVISISTDPSYLWDDEFGIYVEGNGKYGLPGNGVEEPMNWNNNWRRPINFEFFPTNRNTSVLNQLCEMRIAGGWTRVHPQKSLIVYGHKRFGTKRFNHDIFKEKPDQEIKSFMIRNSGNDFWWTHFRDAAIQLFFGGKVDIDYQAYQPAIFYLNGAYWGIQNLRERTTKDFVLANYGLDSDEIDVIGNWWGWAMTGNRIAWDQLMNELQKPSSQRNDEWIMNQVDIDEFINYMILQIFAANTDFPHNNIIMWRPRKDGAKWRFILKDLDFGLGIWDRTPPTFDAMKYNTEDDGNERKLFNALLSQDAFRKKFYRRFAVYMGDLLHYESTSHVIDSIQRMIEPAMQEHITRWMPEMWWRNMDSWRAEVTHMKNWCENRNPEMYQHLQEYFQLGTMMNLTFEKEENLGKTPDVFINGVRMRQFEPNKRPNRYYDLDASYFQNEMVELRYEGNSLLYGWEITKTVQAKTTVETIFQQNLSYLVEDGCTTLNIRLVGKKTHTPEEIAQPIINMYTFDNQLYIYNLPVHSHISIYDMGGRLVTKTSTSNDSIIIPLRQHGIFIVEVRNNAQIFTQKIVNL